MAPPIVADCGDGGGDGAVVRCGGEGTENNNTTNDADNDNYTGGTAAAFENDYDDFEYDEIAMIASLRATRKMKRALRKLQRALRCGLCRRTPAVGRPTCLAGCNHSFCPTCIDSYASDARNDVCPGTCMLQYLYLCIYCTVVPPSRPKRNAAEGTTATATTTTKPACLPACLVSSRLVSLTTISNKYYRISPPFFFLSSSLCVLYMIGIVRFSLSSPAVGFRSPRYFVQSNRIGSADSASICGNVSNGGRLSTTRLLLYFFLLAFSTTTDRRKNKKPYSSELRNAAFQHRVRDEILQAESLFGYRLAVLQGDLSGTPSPSYYR